MSEQVFRLKKKETKQTKSNICCLLVEQMKNPAIKGGHSMKNTLPPVDEALKK